MGFMVILAPCLLPVKPYLKANYIGESEFESLSGYGSNIGDSCPEAVLFTITSLTSFRSGFFAIKSSKDRLGFMFLSRGANRPL